ncbi:MAG: hypothetical protein ACLFSM_01385, partial [Thermoplasmata archaeon]
MLNKWKKSGECAFSFVDQEDMDDEEFYQLFNDNFEDFINSWILKKEIKEYNSEKDLVTTREAYNGYTVVTKELFSGILRNKFHIRKLINVSNEKLNDLDNGVIYDEKENKVYQKQGIASEYLKKSMNKWGEKNGICTLCEEEKKVDDIKQYIYPFTIVRNKFKNLRPRGVENIQICKKCAMKLFSAYSNMIFNLNSDYLNMLVIYSDVRENFTFFKDNVIRKSFKVKYNTNLKGLNKYKFVSRPGELLFATLNEFSKKPEFSLDSEEIDLANINIILAGANVKGNKTIYFDIDHLDSSSEVWELFKTWNDDRENTARLFFLSLAPNIKDEDDLINRNKFIEKLLIQKTIDYKSLEKATFKNISENRRTLAFVNKIILDYLEVMDKMEEKNLYEKTSNIGYRFGKEIERRETNKNKCKGHLYELRRSRDLGNFLDTINSIQTS